MTTVWAGVGLVLGPGEEDTESWLGLLGHTVALYAVIPRRKVEGGALLRTALGARPSASAHHCLFTWSSFGKRNGGNAEMRACATPCVLPRVGGVGLGLSLSGHEVQAQRWLPLCGKFILSPCLYD